MSTNNAAIEYRVGPNDELRTIPRSQAAALLRSFHANRGRPLVWDDLYQALGKSPEVPRVLHELRRKWGIPILCTLTPKASGLGKYGLYRLGDEVEVREPVRGTEGGEA